MGVFYELNMTSGARFLITKQVVDLIKKAIKEKEEYLFLDEEFTLISIKDIVSIKLITN